MKKPAILLLLLLFVCGCQDSQPSQPETPMQKILRENHETDPCVISLLLQAEAYAIMTTPLPNFPKTRTVDIQTTTFHTYSPPRPAYYTPPPQGFITSDNPSIIEPDGYGLGVHKNRFAQPVRLRPDFGGVDGEYLEIKTDAYGFGIHSDQYGRPVREYPWP